VMAVEAPIAAPTDHPETGRPLRLRREGNAARHSKAQQRKGEKPAKAIGKPVRA
jgi:hypothetical protein